MVGGNNCFVWLTSQKGREPATKSTVGGEKGGFLACMLGGGKKGHSRKRQGSEQELEMEG